MSATPANTLSTRAALPARRISKMARKEAITGYLFATPWLLGLVFFIIGPILASLYLSFTRYNLVTAPTWIGMENYTQAFTRDRQFWSSLQRSFLFALYTVPLGVAGSLFLAIMLNQGLKGTSLCRTLFFLPHLTPVVAMAILWKWLLQAEVGPVNYLLHIVGLPTVPWLSSQRWALFSLSMISVWGSVGSNRMLIFLASLQGVPEELYEAAEIDGAGKWAQIRHVTIPMISPAIFFNVVMGVIGALQVFALAFVATEGGPGYATRFFGLHIYFNAFNFYQMGYASALAWVLAVVIFVLTFIQLRASDRWVFYAS